VTTILRRLPRWLLRRRISPFAAAVLAVALAACGTDTVTDPDTPPQGEYVLASVNGAPPPVVMKDDPSARVELVAGRLEVTGGGFTQRLEFLESIPRGSTPVARESVTTGTVSASGSRMRFRVSGGGEWEATHSGVGITYTIQGNNGPLVFVFVPV
jgi:hypothetical protein